MSREKTKLVYGVGRNDADYKVRTKVISEGKLKSVLCPYYYRWTNMLKRCYGDKGKPLYRNYEGCTVSPDWLTFSNFKAWMETQDWEGKVLDKDLLVHGNKVYSEDTCCFIDVYLNTLITRSTRKKGFENLPLGASKAVRGNNIYYMATMVKRGGYRDAKWGKGYGYLGYTTNPLDAHRIWQKAKRDHFQELLDEYQDLTVKKGIQRVVDMLNIDIDNNFETKHL